MEPPPEQMMPVRPAASTAMPRLSGAVMPSSAWVVHLRKVPDATGDTGCAGDRYPGPSSNGWPRYIHGRHPEFVRLADEGGRFGEHLSMLAEVDRVADAHDVDAVVDQGHHVVHVPHRHAHRVTLGRLYEVRFSSA